MKSLALFRSMLKVSEYSDWLRSISIDCSVEGALRIISAARLTFTNMVYCYLLSAYCQEFKIKLGITMFLKEKNHYVQVGCESHGVPKG